MSASRLAWYWHRLRAMSLREMGAHARKKFYQFADARRERDWTPTQLPSSGDFPRLPEPARAPAVLREGLRKDVDHILAGRWQAFGHLDLKVDDPPRWQTDYLVGKNLATNELAFKLNHRELPGGADIKLIWELSRWYQLVRLAQGAYVLGDRRAAEQCVRWLKDWVAHNPPYRGWNWTSALESGMRLIQFTWIDALLGPSAKASGYEGELQQLRHQILPPHVWFTWRYKSFGSSANNHLLGELAGLIVATARWPALTQWGARLETLQSAWEREVLAQFAEDGGNREQALNYHLFSWEFCWQARAALAGVNRKTAPSAERRLQQAPEFFTVVHAQHEPWDYGDSDNAYVTPFFASERTALLEWRDWLRGTAEPSALGYWLGDSPTAHKKIGAAEPLLATDLKDWWVYQQTGIAICESGFWWLRWDLSPLGYLKTAAHGHLDALHLSVWFKGTAMIIDPGTGAYYADKELRSWLASRAAHNGPCPVDEELSSRLGPFLWAAHHARPTYRIESSTGSLIAELRLPNGMLRRAITRIEAGDGWQIEDSFESSSGGAKDFTVRWQFAPGTWVKRLGERKFSLNRGDVSILIETGASWAEVNLIERESEREVQSAGNDLEGIVSPAFRKTVWAPYLKLTARGGEKPCIFRTIFLVSGSS